MTEKNLTQQQVKEINDTTRYLMFSVFKARGPLGDINRDAAAAEIEQVFAAGRTQDLVVRGCYDVSGLRADADFMVWTHAPEIETLQTAFNDVRKTTVGQHLDAVWSVAAMHKPAEFNRRHVPAFMAGEEPEDYLCVYPFVRSYDWYLLPADERRQILAAHGKAAREYPDVRANTVASFALGDYEWILAFEAPKLDRIVDLMHEMRYTEARRHVREETPFYTGRRRSIQTLIHNLP